MRAFIAALLIALVLAIFSTTPPSPRPADSDLARFSAVRAMTDVRVIAARPHMAGTPENAAVRTYIAKRMTDLGMEVSSDPFLASPKAVERHNKWSGGQIAALPLANVIGVLPGRDRTLPAVMLMAHHDTVMGSPGAADDTAGIAASLEIVRAIKARGRPRRDLVVLATDGEELGLEGARHFFAANPLRNRIGAVINLEARGGGGRAAMFQTSRDNGNAMRLYAANVGRPSASSLAAFIYSVLPNDTDLTPALPGPYAMWNFAFIGRSGLYHSPLSTPDRLDQGAVQDMGGQALDLTAALLAADAMPAPAPDAVFFDVFGLFTAIWPAAFGWVLLVVAAIALGLVIRRDRGAGLLSGAGRMTGLVLLSALLLYAFNRLSIGLARPEYYDRLAAIPRLEAVAAAVAIASFLILFGRAAPTRGVSAGAVLPLLALGIAGQLMAPTAAYLVIVPVALAAVALWLDNRWVSLAIATVVTGYMLGMGHFVMQGVGPGMPMAVALPLALAALTLLPLWPGLTTRPWKIAILSAFAGAAAIALWVQQDAPAESQAAYVDSKI